jgi:hypothetical protein
MDVAELIWQVKSADPKIAEPAARSLRELARIDPAVLTPWRKDLLQVGRDAEDLRVRWNLIVIVGKLSLTRTQRASAIDWLFERLRDESSLTRTFALQALVDLSATDSALRKRVLPILENFAREGTPAMRARARKLL